MARLKRLERRPGGAIPPARSISRTFPFAIFALLITAAPLAFGAVDRLSQVALVSLLAIGLLVCPPAPLRLGRTGNALVLLGLVIFVGKEFAPASIFGSASWRDVLTANYAMSFPWTHHPEPARAVDALLVEVIALVWFLWVRTLAAERENRPILAWTMLGSAAIVAVVSFATRGIDPQAIYGLRYTQGWFGFGPFPNRNHTASFLAMGAIVGCGCATWAAMRQRYFTVAAAVAAVAIVLAALLTTQSRGGLLSLGGGLSVFLALVMFKLRDRRALGIALGAGVVIGGAALTFGSKVIARFSAENSGGEMAHYARLNVWRDTVAMWQDAPLFGHGLGSFTQLFPMYQKIELLEQVVLHPESSWLQWLAELGALPVLIGIIALAGLVVPGLRATFASQQSFYLRAAGFAAASALLGHAFIDVPAHRWGTAALALAALALASSPTNRVDMLSGTRKSALAPLVIVALWAIPFLTSGPAWSPLAHAQVLAKTRTRAFVDERELQRSLHYFPLSPALHQALGATLASTRGSDPARWQQHFRIAARLVPASWSLLVEQARVSARLSPGYALHCWQRAIERAGRRRDEIFRLALHETAQLPGAAITWSSYVETQPDLLLVYAQAQPTHAAELYTRWWESRALRDARITDAEVAEFYALAGRFGTAAQLELWIARHPERAQTDTARWAALFHQWGSDKRAWELLSPTITEPDFPSAAPGLPQEELQELWETHPDNILNARALAQSLAWAGKMDESREVIVAVAQRPKAPAWFIHKAAFLLAKRHDYAGAVQVLLQER